MQLAFHQKLLELRLTYHEFFRVAYLWKFGKLQDLTADCADYRLCGHLPKYATEYLAHLQGEHPCK